MSKSIVIQVVLSSIDDKTKEQKVLADIIEVIQSNNLESAVVFVDNKKDPKKYKKEGKK